MDALTHSLVGITLWRAGAAPPGPRLWSAAAVLVAANAADAEGFLRLAGAGAYLRHYHGASHSLLGTALLALAVAGIAALGLKRAKQPVPAAPLIGAILFSSAAHLALDLLHGYGERLFWPFSAQRYGTFLMAPFDVANLLIVIIALAMPLLLNLVNAEIGAARVNAARFALAGLLLLAALAPVRHMFRSRADEAAAAALTEQQESFAVHPSPFLPWDWYLVQDTPISYLVQEVNALDRRVSGGMLRFRKPVPNSLLIAARDTESGRAFLELAVYPLFSMEQGHRGVVVRIRDVQFYVPGSSDRPYSVEVEVNSQLHILSERALF